MNLRPYQLKHRNNMMAYVNLTDRAFREMIAKVISLYGSIPMGSTFDIANFPSIKRGIDIALREMAKQIESNIINGITREWNLANSKNDALLESIIGKNPPKQVAALWMNQNLDALKAFNSRKIEGLKLSDRVWSAVRGQRLLLEQNMALGILEGTPAAKLATEMKQYLKDPDMLFRRVRDAQGELKLSKAASEYHPGKGVYRSSYKNALRMTRTETNLAYQKSDNQRWKQQDFIIGVRVQRSSAASFPCEICDAGVGDYPKEYEWDLWHPNCLCFATPILAGDDEINKAVQDILNGDDPSFSGYVEKIPEEMQDLQNAGFNHYGH